MIHILHTPSGQLASAKLDANKQLFLTAVLSFRKTEMGCRMSHAAIAEQLVCSKSTVIRMLKELEANGWITIKKIKRKGTKENESNQYIATDKLLKLVDSSKMKPGSVKMASPGSVKMEQNTLLSEEKSIERNIRSFLEERPSLKKAYESQVEAYGIQYANNSILNMMKPNQTQTV